MNGASLVELFRTHPIDYTDPYMWEDTDVLAWINEAEREAAIRARLIFDRTTSAYCAISVTAGTARYAVNAKVFDISRAFFTDANSTRTTLEPRDRTELDRVFSDWRTTTEKPGGYVFDDTSITLDRLPDTAGTIALEVYRLPAADVTFSTSPEIAAIHHGELVNWACYKALSTGDFEQIEETQQRANKYLALFEQYFGRKPSADLRRRQRANTPHVNKAWW